MELNKNCIELVMMWVDYYYDGFDFIAVFSSYLLILRGNRDYLLKKYELLQCVDDL